MASVNFYLDQKDVECKPIFLYFRYDKKTLKYNTGEKATLKEWHLGKQRMKPNVIGAEQINAFLDSLEEKIQTIYREFKKEDIIPTVEMLKERLQPKKIEPTPKSIVEKADFFKLFKRFIELSKSTKAYNTTRNYLSVYNHIKAFNDQYSYNITFDGINFNLYHDLIEYCTEDCSLSNNSVSSVIKNLKVFLKYAEEVGVKVNQDYLKFKCSYKNPERIFLDWEEIKKLQKLDLRKRKSLEHVRDIYLFSCYTGLRYGDIVKLKPEHIYEIKQGKEKVKVIRIIQEKTKDNLELALNDYAKEIIEKYEGKFLNALPVISNQKTNDHLKEIGELAKLTTPVNRVKHVGGKRIDSFVPKYELLTMHTARHTFATLSLQKNMPVEVLQKILGHKKISNTMIYGKIVESHKHKQMLDVWKKK